jgi:hypothetical protein
VPLVLSAFRNNVFCAEGGWGAVREEIGAVGEGTIRLQCSFALSASISARREGAGI